MRLPSIKSLLPALILIGGITALIISNWSALKSLWAPEYEKEEPIEVTISTSDNMPATITFTITDQRGTTTEETVRIESEPITQEWWTHRTYTYRAIPDDPTKVITEGSVDAHTHLETVAISIGSISYTANVETLYKQAGGEMVVRLNGEKPKSARGSKHLFVDIEPGTHELFATANGYLPHFSTITIEPHLPLEDKIILGPIADQPDPRSGTWNITQNAHENCAQPELATATYTGTLNMTPTGVSLTLPPIQDQGSPRVLEGAWFDPHATLKANRSSLRGTLTSNKQLMLTGSLAGTPGCETGTVQLSLTR